MGDIVLRLLAFAERLFPRLVNRIKIIFLVRKEKRRRPHPYSLWTGADTGPPVDLPATPDQPGPVPSPYTPSGYVSWPGLVDRSFTGRHLPPDPNWTGQLPDPDEVFEKLFKRQGPMTPCKSTTALFCFFAQWFTDSFLRTDRNDRRRHTGNNEIDFCQIYGLAEATALTLRTRRGGLMRMRPSPQGDRLPFLVLRDGPRRGEVDPEFHALPYIDRDPGTGATGRKFRDFIAASLEKTVLEDERWENMYATGLDRGNSTIFYTALSTMCVREHNRLAMRIAALYPQWDDDRLFETARLVNIRNVLEIVIEDYINHIAGNGSFKLDPDFAERQPWYRTNRISLEFNLLYRWHMLVPDSVDFEGQRLEHLDYRFNNIILERSSPEALINAASAASAGRIGVRNTPVALKKAELASLKLAREFRLQPFNAYCQRFGHARYDNIDDLCRDRDTADVLKGFYGGDVDKVEFLVGLYAEGRTAATPHSVLPPLLRTMVAVDAFTHIFTNPVLSSQVREAGFPENIAELMRDTGGVAGLMARNSHGPVKAVPRFALPS